MNPTWKLAKQHLRHGLRTLQDVRSGHWFAFARPGGEPESWPAAHQLRQAILPSETFRQKHANLSLACREIARTTLLPNQLFSFWTILGQPAAHKGYQASRNITGGRLTLETGGGLCQLAGLLYHLALGVGLPVLERHAHSLDLYTEEERHTPLGADAAVVYGYKDLRIANNSGAPLRFDFILEQEQLTGLICSPIPLEVFPLEFIRQDQDDRKIVKTVRHTPRGPEVLAFSVYQTLAR